jgi:hypothetical protein
MVAGLEAWLDSDPGINSEWGVCSKWDYNVRYRPEYMTDRAATIEFVEACESVYHWVRSRLLPA